MIKAWKTEAGGRAGHCVPCADMSAAGRRQAGSLSELVVDALGAAPPRCQLVTDPALFGPADSAQSSPRNTVSFLWLVVDLPRAQISVSMSGGLFRSRPGVLTSLPGYDMYRAPTQVNLSLDKPATLMTQAERQCLCWWYGGVRCRV